MTSATFKVRAMTSGDATTIASWRYPAEYAFYNWDADLEDLAELLDPAGWGAQYFAVDGSGGDVVGFFQFKKDRQAAEMGLGLRPDLTGQGLGLAFLEAGIGFVSERFGATSITLAVAVFNQRAINVYRRAGFEITDEYEHETNGGIHTFVRMTREKRIPIPEPHSR